MVIRDIAPINFLFFRAETDLGGLETFVPVGQELFSEAVQHRLPITGPLHWHYFGFTGVDAKFTLEISLPVGAVLDAYDGKFHFKRSSSFRAVTTFHAGAWQDLPRTYDKITRYISRHHLVTTGINREVYVNVDFQHHRANLTEIQVGVK